MIIREPWNIFLVTITFLAGVSAPVAFADDPYSGQPGSLDLHFGEWGMGIGAVPETVESAEATAIGIDTQNRIVVGGAACFDSDCHPVLSRFQANGSRDLTGAWGPDASVLLSAADIGRFTPANVQLAAADADGWWATWYDFTRCHLLKVQADGSFATGFAPGDISSACTLNTNEGLHTANVGGIDYLLAVHEVFGTPTSITVERRRAADGQLDATFGTGGVLSLPLSSDNEWLLDSKVFSDGRVALLSADFFSGVSRVRIAAADGSGLSDVYGNNGEVDLTNLLAGALAGSGFNVLFVDTIGIGIGMQPGGSLLVGFAVCCNAGNRYQSGVVALDGNGDLDGGYAGGNGYVLHPVQADFFAPIGFAVDPATGRSVHEVLRDTDAFDGMQYFTANGAVDGNYGSGSGEIRNLVFPGGNGISKWDAALMFDANGGVLLANDRFGWPHNVLGLDGFGIARFLASGEARIYDDQPDEISDFEWPSAPVDEVIAPMLTGFAGRDVAVIASITGGKLGLETDDSDDYSFLSSNAVIPLGVTVKPFHHTADDPGEQAASLISAGSAPMQFVLSSVTGADTTPDPLAFSAIANIAPGAFVVSSAAVVRGIDVAIDVSVENGCYFIYNDADDIPPQPPEAFCTTSDRTVTDGQWLLVGHRTATAAHTEKVTVLHVGPHSLEFKSTTGDLPPVTGPGDGDSGNDSSGDDGSGDDGSGDDGSGDDGSGDDGSGDDGSGGGGSGSSGSGGGGPIDGALLLVFAAAAGTAAKRRKA